METIPFVFQWKLVHPDYRQYRQQSIELEPVNVFVAIGVPLDKDHIYNFSEITVSQLSGGIVPNAVLSAKGLAFCLDNLGSGFDETKPTENTDDWDDDEEGEKETKNDTKQLKNSDDWDDDDTNDKSHATNEKWDEDTEDWE